MSFQGLGLPYLSLEKLAESLHFIQKDWGMKTAMGNILRCSFELNQIETDLQGNFPQKKFKQTGNPIHPQLVQSSMGITVVLPNGA